MPISDVGCLFFGLVDVEQQKRLLVEARIQFRLRVDFVPPEIAGLGKCRHLVGRTNEQPHVRQKFSIEELGKRAISHWLELAHVDVMLFDEGLYLSRTTARVLIERNQPIIERFRFEPLREGTARLALIGGRMMFHKFLKKAAGLAVPYWQSQSRPLGK